MKIGRAIPFSGWIYFMITILTACSSYVFAQKPEIKLRQIRGNAHVVIGLAENANLADPFDSISQPTTFTYKVTFLPPREQVESDFVFQGVTKKGRPITIRLVRPGTGIADFAARKIELDLVFELSLGGKKFQIPVRWTTDRINDAFGTEQGKVDNVNLANETADIKLVGSGSFTAQTKDLIPDAPQNQQLNFVIRLILDEAKLSGVN